MEKTRDSEAITQPTAQVALDPSAQQPEEESKKEANNENSEVVNFETAEDPSDPLNWSNTYKWSAVALVSMSTTLALGNAFVRVLKRG